jgi:hypothetical protein
MDPHPYGRKPGAFLEMTHEERVPVVRKICQHIVAGNRPETACWSEQVDPEDLKAVLREDLHMNSYFMAKRAEGERKLMKTLKEGGKGMSEARAALEILERTFKGWERKATVNLPKQLEEVLEKLQASFEANKTFTGAQAYDIVIGELERGA